MFSILWRTWCYNFHHWYTVHMYGIVQHFHIHRMSNQHLVEERDLQTNKQEREIEHILGFKRLLPLATEFELSKLLSTLSLNLHYHLRTKPLNTVLNTRVVHVSYIHSIFRLVKSCVYKQCKRRKCIKCATSVRGSAMTSVQPRTRKQLRTTHSPSRSLSPINTRVSFSTPRMLSLILNHDSIAFPTHSLPQSTKRPCPPDSASTCKHQKQPQRQWPQ